MLFYFILTPQDIDIFRGHIETLKSYASTLEEARAAELILKAREPWFIDEAENS